MIPRQYRTVAFTDVEIDLDEQSLREFFLSRQVYRRTRFVVARRGAEIAVVELVKTAEENLFVDVAQVRMLARPEETILVVRPDIDTAVPSLLAGVAADAPDGIRCVVVRGRYEHINFILDGAPRRIHVLDVAPPWPAKLVDQVQRVVDTAEDLPATECVPQVVDLKDLAAAAPAEHYLLPCRGGGMSVPGAMISYLDEVPPEGDWTLLGCARSRAIHDHFYPDRAATLRQVDTCPIHLATTLPLLPGAARLTKCCLLEEHIETQGDTVVVPWGSSFTLVAQGLSLASDLADRRNAELLDRTAGKDPA